MWSTGKSATLRPPSPQKPPSTPDGQVVTATTSSSAATAASGSTSTRVPLPAVAPDGAPSVDADTHAPPLGDTTTASTSAVPPAWKTSHRTTSGMANIYVVCFNIFPFFSVICWVHVHYCGDRVTCELGSRALCVAAVGTAWSLLGSPWDGQAASPLSKTFAVWKCICRVIHCECF